MRRIATMFTLAVLGLGLSSIASRADEKKIPLTPVSGFPDLFAIAAADCALNEGWVYHYWFETEDSDPRRTPPQRVLSTDPTAFAVDWRLLAPRLPAPFTADDRQPAAVIKYRGGQLVACDPAGEEANFTGEPSPATLVRLAPAPVRLATILKSRALVGLTVPAPVTVPSDGITRSILSRRVPSGA